MNRLFSYTLLLFLLCTSVYSQEIIQVWGTEKAPTQNGLTDSAELVVYFPETSNLGRKTFPAVLICPGGGYASVSMEYEGRAFAKWMASQGFVSVILKYRLPNKHKEIPFDDATKAMSIIRVNADKWNIDISRIGIAGFSAGGHLASIFSNLESDYHPAFSILFYPVISFEEVTKGGTRRNLLGENPSVIDIFRYSADKQVTEQTPPTIIFMADNDPSVPSTHATMYYNELKKNNLPASLYLFDEGGHGWAMLDSFKYNKECLDLLKLWFEKNVLNVN